MDDLIVLLSTTPPGESERIARTLVEEGLAACVNVTDVRSVFRWEGEMAVEREHLLIIKARSDRLDAITSRIRALHPYEVPEIIALPIIGGYEGYLAWVAGSGGT